MEAQLNDLPLEHLKMLAEWLAIRREKVTAAMLTNTLAAYGPAPAPKNALESAGLPPGVAARLAGAAAESSVQQQDVGDPRYRQAVPAVSRVMHGDECVGTAAAVQYKSQVYVFTARHCLAEGRALIAATAFGGQPLRFVAAFPRHDLAVFKIDNPPPNALHFSRITPYIGQPVWLLGYPLILDLPEGADAPDDAPAYFPGSVCMTFATNQLVTADHRGGFPNSSGAPVIDEVGGYAGMHITAVWHLIATLGHEDVVEALIPDMVDKDAGNIWVEPTPSSDGSSATVASMGQQLAAVSLSAKHSLLNIPEKGSLPQFVPYSVILRKLEDAGETEPVRGSLATRLGQSYKRYRTGGP